MAGFKRSSIFPQNPYHIPGYGGYVPQFTFTFGDTYGRTTHHLLTDPSVRKSPRSLLAPLDNKENLLEYHYHIDHPGYVTYQPITSPAEAPLGPQPVPTVLEDPVLTPLEPQPWQCPPALAVPGLQQSPPEPLQGLALHPAAQEMDRELAMAPLAQLLGKGTGTCPCNCAGSNMKMFSFASTQGYTGYIPCSLDNVGLTYLSSVKKAMKEFDRRQLLEKNPPYTLGTRFPLTHWPDTKIYSRAGLIPNYLGFVPHLQDIHGLTYGDGTRESYRCEQRRRGLAL
ncbi:protein FAM166A [Passer montanus]|uniref:protein FAM166A n=1 Tax=Passer montanus TaxID=9160 RepID=UPI001960B556|nr:protein FAM166A [Passer montanus]